MDKYPILKPRIIIKALSQKGFYYKSQKGSHAKYTDGKLTVIIPMHTTIAQGTLKSILAQANVKLKDFLDLL